MGHVTPHETLALRWAAAEFIARHADVRPYPAAPEICVEVWVVSEDGAWQGSDAQGPQSASHYGVQLALAPAAPR